MKRLMLMVVLGFCLGGYVGGVVGGIVQAADPVLPHDILRDARAGDAEAQLEMGILYEYGFRMKGNRVVALAWYYLAAKQGGDRAVKYHDRLSAKLSTAQVAAARKQSTRLVAQTRRW